MTKSFWQLTVKFSITLVFVLSIKVLMAQLPDPGGGEEPTGFECVDGWPDCGPCGGPPCPIPIDGGASAVLITGMIVGGVKLYKSQKRD